MAIVFSIQISKSSLLAGYFSGFSRVTVDSIRNQRIKKDKGWNMATDDNNDLKAAFNAAIGFALDGAVRRQVSCPVTLIVAEQLFFIVAPVMPSTAG